jgi:hypothetical protein
MHTRERVIFAMLVIAGLTLIGAHAPGETFAQAMVAACLLATVISASPAALPGTTGQPRGSHPRRKTGSRIRDGQAGKGFSTASP